MSDWGKGVNNNIGWGQGGTNDIGYGSIYADSNSGLTLLLKDNTAFTIEVKTDNAGTSNDNQFQFTGAVGDYDVVAKQNNIVVATFDNLSGAETITFPSSGVYVLELTAKEVSPFTGMRFDDSGDKLKLSKINQWGLFNDTRQSLFFGCSNLTEIGSDVNWLNLITDGSNMFRDCNLTSLPSGMTLDNLTEGGLMFFRCNLTSLPSGMTLENLTVGGAMFFGCNLSSLPSGMTLDNLTDGANMFAENTINTVRYSELLVDMEADNSNTSVSFHGGNSKYNTSGETARNLLINNQTWSFTDGGPA